MDDDSTATRALRGLGPRTPPFETQTYWVTALLVKARPEADHDNHLVVAQPGPSQPYDDRRGTRPNLSGYHELDQRQPSHAPTPPSSRLAAWLRHSLSRSSPHGTATITGVG